MLLIGRCGVQGSAAASPAAGAGEEAEHGQGPGRIQALLQGEDEALRPGGSTLTSLFLLFSVLRIYDNSVRIRVQIRILLFSSFAFRTPTKN
jgi:hypothetical protein